MAMSLWPSRGLGLTGFEIKTDRSDWLREKVNPEKADEIGALCDYWYLVVSDTGMIKDGELPETWGLMAANGKGLKTIREAEKNSHPKELTRAFLAAILRRAEAESASKAEIQNAVEKAVAEQEEKFNERITRELERSRPALHDLKEEVAAFEEASGIKIVSGWRHGKQVGETVRMVLDTGVDGVKNRLGYVVKQLRDNANQIEKTIRGSQ